ncbi:hypothetical protein TB2_030656 [Malus domestica]
MVFIDTFDPHIRSDMGNIFCFSLLCCLQVKLSISCQAAGDHSLQKTLCSVVLMTQRTLHSVGWNTSRSQEYWVWEMHLSYRWSILVLPDTPKRHSNISKI